MEFPTDRQRLGAVSKNTTTQTSYCTQRAVRPTAIPKSHPMGNRQPHPANQAAAIAMQKARTECALAGLNHEPYAEQLTELVILEVRKALAEMAEHQAQGGPSAILMLTQPLYQNIYFADAGRQAAETLLTKLNIKGGHQIQ